MTLWVSHARLQIFRIVDIGQHLLTSHRHPGHSISGPVTLSKFDIGPG